MISSRPALNCQSLGSCQAPRLTFSSDPESVQGQAAAAVLQQGAAGRSEPDGESLRPQLYHWPAAGGLECRQRGPAARRAQRFADNGRPLRVVRRPVLSGRRSHADAVPAGLVPDPGAQEHAAGGAVPRADPPRRVRLELHRGSSAALGLSEGYPYLYTDECTTLVH